MYKHNKIHQNSKRTILTTVMAIMLVASFFSMSAVNNVNGSTKKATMLNSTHNQGSELTGPDGFGTETPVQKIADPDSYTHEVDYDSVISLDDTTEQRIDVTVEQSGFDLGVPDIPVNIEVELSVGSIYTDSDTTNNNGKTTFIIPLDGDGQYPATIVIDSPEDKGGPFEKDITWEVTGTPVGPGGGSGSYDVEVSVAKEEVDIEDNPLQLIITTVKDAVSGDPLEGIKLDIGVTNPSGSVKEDPRMTDVNGEDRFKVNVDEVGEYDAVVEVKDPDTGDVIHTEDISWTAS